MPCHGRLFLTDWVSSISLHVINLNFDLKNTTLIDPFQKRVTKQAFFSWKKNPWKFLLKGISSFLPISKSFGSNILHKCYNHKSYVENIVNFFGSKLSSIVFQTSFLLINLFRSEYKTTRHLFHKRSKLNYFSFNFYS